MSKEIGFRLFLTEIINHLYRDNFTDPGTNFTRTGNVIKRYALQLISLLKGTMGIDPGKAFKLETPYGLQLKWMLPHGMPFILHLKDKVKVYCSICYF